MTKKEPGTLVLCPVCNEGSRRGKPPLLMRQVNGVKHYVHAGNCERKFASLPAQAKGEQA